MARPKKKGLDYFPFDVNLFEDEKIRAISGEFGIKGEITVVKLLCAIYRNGYFASWNELTKMHLLGQLPGISLTLLESIVNRLAGWGFFDKSLFDTVRVLTSKAIQRRYCEATKRRTYKREYYEYWLLDDEVERPFLHTETELMYTETPVYVYRNPQRKDKHSLSYSFKGENLNINNNAREDLQLSDSLGNPVQDTIQRMKKDSGWIRSVQQLMYREKQTLLSENEIVEYLTTFSVKLGADGKKMVYYMDACQHFTNWLRIVLKIKKDESTTNNRGYRGDKQHANGIVLGKALQNFAKPDDGMDEEMADPF